MCVRACMLACVCVCVCVCVNVFACVCVCEHVFACVCLHLCFILEYLKLVIYCFGQLLHREEEK